MRTKISNAFFKYHLSESIKLLLLIALPLFINTLAINTLAASEEEPQAEANSSEDSKVLSPEKKPESKQQPSKTQSSKPRKVSGYKPSEKISEDYSVPFPVDI